MIYYYDTEFADFGPAHVFCGYFNDEQSFFTGELLNSAETLRSLKMNGIDLSILWPDEKEVPILIIKDITSASVKISVIYNALQNAATSNKEILKDKDFLTRFKTQIDASARQINLNAAEIFNSVCKQVVWEITTSVSDINVISDLSLIESSHRDTVNKLNELHVSSASAIGGIDPSENVTKFQESCTDELFIQLPSSNEIYLEDVNIDAYTPSKYELNRPFMDEDYYTPKVVNKVNKGSIDYYRVFGKNENNTYEIYSNEEKYYKALTSWVESNMITDVSGTKPVIDSITQEYLECLIARLYFYGWGHSKYIPYEIDAGNRGDGEGTISTIESKYVMRIETGTTEPPSNAIINLHCFLESMCAKFDYTVYIDTVIQLARWGDRKQTKLVYRHTDDVFDLNNGIATKAALITGSLNYVDIQPGYRYTISRYLTIENKVVGVELQSVMTDSSGSVFDIYTEISIVDAIRLNEGDNKILNAELLSKDSLDSSIPCVDINSIEDAQNIQYYDSAELKNLRMSAGIIRANQTQLTMLKTLVDNLSLGIDVSKLQLASKDDITRVVQEQRVSASVVIAFNVLHNWISIVESFNKQSDISPKFWYDFTKNCNPKERLDYNACNQSAVKEEQSTINQSNIKEEQNSNSQSVSNVSSSTPQAVNNSTAQTMTAFGGANQSNPTPADKDVTSTFSIYKEANTEQVANVVYNNQVIAQVAITYITRVSKGQTKRNTVYTILDAAIQRTANVNDIPIFKILAHAVNFQNLVSIGAVNLQQMFYENKNAFLQFRTIVNKLV